MSKNNNSENQSRVSLFVFFGALCVLPFLSLSNEINESQSTLNPKGHFFIKKGVKREVCQDLVTYMNQNVDIYLSHPKKVMESKHKYLVEKVTEPSKKIIFIRALIQNVLNEGFYLTGRNSWLNQIENIKTHLTSDLELNVINVDINNEGTLDRILTASLKGPRYPRTYFNVVIDNLGNLNSDFQKGGITYGDIFIHKKTTYTYSDYSMSKQVRIGSLTPYYKGYTAPRHENIIGLQQSTICVFQFVNSQQ